MAKNNTKWIFVLVLIMIFVNVEDHKKEYSGGLGFKQYAGTLVPCGMYDWMYGWPYQIAQSNTANLYDYRIETQILSRSIKYTFNGCKTKEAAGCTGNYIRTDEYGCDVWNTYLGKYCRDSAGTAWPATNEWCADAGVGSPCCKDRVQECSSYYNCWYTYPDSGVTFDNFGECGGADLTLITDNEGCYSRNKIFYKNEEAYSDSEDIGGLEVLRFKDGVKVDTADYDMEIQLHTGHQYYDESGRVACAGYDDGYYVTKGCQAVYNSFVPNPNVAINVIEHEVTSNQLEYTVKVEGENIQGDLITSINVGSQTTEQTQYINTATSSTYSNTLTLSNSGDISITPRLELLVPGSQTSGLNGICADQTNNNERELAGCSKIYVTTKTGQMYRAYQFFIEIVARRLQFFQGTDTLNSFIGQANQYLG